MAHGRFKGGWVPDNREAALFFASGAKMSVAFCANPPHDAGNRV